MKSKLPVLEYSAVTTRGKMPKWGFRFRTAEGAVLIESPLHYRSQSEAERAFTALIKSIASNQYTVELPKVFPSTSDYPVRARGRMQLKVKTLRRGLRAFAGSISMSSRRANGWR